MAFINEEANVKDERQANDWKYLQDLGIKMIWGDFVGPSFSNLVVDRNRNYYLVSLGMTNPNSDNVKISYYALCIYNKVIYMEVDEQRSGSGLDKTFECHWSIKKMEFPDDWSFDLVDKEEFREIIKEAFIAETYNATLMPEDIKSLTVEFAEKF